MEVILVPCSGRKRPGGRNAFEAPAWLDRSLRPEARDRLLAARRELGTFFGLPPAPDLGFSASQRDVGFLPAWERYDGNVFRAANFRDLYAKCQGKIVMIVSALYGLLRAEDPIRDYSLMMDCKGPDGLRLVTWWKHRGLGQLVAECALSFRPPVVHDLLSGAYRKALAPWPASPIREVIHQDQFPGQGIGADHARGRQLRKILEDSEASRSPMRFARRQLIGRDHNPLEDPEGPDRADLEKRYGLGERRVGLDHAAAVRGILVRDEKQWKWIWDWGLLHDEIVRKYGYDRLHARYRNEYTFLPTIEFEGHAEIEPLKMLLRDTPILPDDSIQIVGWDDFRAFSIRDALSQLGEPLGA